MGHTFGGFLLMLVLIISAYILDDILQGDRRKRNYKDRSDNDK